MIPVVDLAAQPREIAREVDAGFASVMARTAFVAGDEVHAFERELAGFVGVEHCVGVANGTDTLSLPLFPHITAAAQQERVAAARRAALQGAA